MRMRLGRLNRRRVLATLQISVVLGGLIIGAGSLYATIIAGIFRYIFGLDEGTALLWIGGPIFLIFSVWGVIYLPSPLRKAGILSDDPRRFGSWFI